MSEDLIKALLGEPEEKEFTFGKKKLVLRTLKQSEMNEVMSGLTRADFTMLELEKVPLLARSLVSIDGVKVAAFTEIQDAFKKDEKVDVTYAVEKVLEKMDTATINILYSMYNELVQEASKKKDLLKNASRVQSGGPSTESAKPSK